MDLEEPSAAETEDRHRVSLGLLCEAAWPASPRSPSTPMCHLKAEEKESKSESQGAIPRPLTVPEGSPLAYSVPMTLVPQEWQDRLAP